jgi:hypothetical protein
VPHPLAPHLRQRDLDAAAVADVTPEPDPLELPAVALPVLDRPEDPLAEEAVLLGLEGPIVDRLGLRDLTERPGLRISSGEAILIWMKSKSEPRVSRDRGKSIIRPQDIPV